MKSAKGDKGLAIIFFLKCKSNVLFDDGAKKLKAFAEDSLPYWICGAEFSISLSF